MNCMFELSTLTADVFQTEPFTSKVILLISNTPSGFARLSPRKVGAYTLYPNS